MGRQGTSVVETLVALLLGLFLLQAGMWTVARARTLHERLAARAEALAAVRLAGSLLREEASSGMEEVDWHVSGDALSLRAFRGTGLVCGAQSGADTVVTAFRGYRRPDPSKDSVLLLYPEGEREIVALRAWSASADTLCDGNPLSDRVVLRLASIVPRGAVVARVFERGGYALSGRALRYRRGAGGRQPLTPELWTPETGWRQVGGRLEAELVHGARFPGGERRWRIPIAPGTP